MPFQETQSGNNSVGVEPHNDPFSSADGMTARHLTNTSGEPSIERAREAFDRAASSDRGSYDRSMCRPRGVGQGSNASGSNSALLLLCGIGFGAALMYLLDPAQGGKRRSLLRDKIAGAKNQAG